MEWLSISFFKPFLSWVLNFVQGRLGVDRDHDVAIFRKIDAIGTESRIDQILNSRIYNSRLNREDHHTLGDLIEALSRIENRFLDSTLQKAAEELRDEMTELLGFVSRTFFSVSGGWHKFYPDPIDKDYYDKQWAELCSKLEKSWETYKSFRMTVKKRLKT
ncbi:hypothetical protein ACYX34_15155 [Nitrospira sp. CMX1]